MVSIKSCFTGISVTLESLALVGHITSASRQCKYNVNRQMCHMSMSLTSNTHTHNIENFWVITSRGARKQFGILIFFLWMTPAPLPDHLTPLPCLISLMNWLLHHLLITFSSSHNILPLLPLPLHNHPSLRFCTPAAPS
ncbi:hypothetical protein O181_003449 [Austropuccinia psidii MF-1]|uniref:Uncharacterized protein n=1 Tax=Austropuccinia psidii MF-1 TaxID=1389203 RepID=A0A9Q3GDV8_9BASI|nr:hypothetical protein [Austropuccinia psidii MF-1]